MQKSNQGRRPAVPHPQREKSYVRPAVLDAAKALFRSQRYESISIERIAAAAQVTRHSLHNHFASKDEIFRMSRDALIAQVVQKIPEDIPLELSLRDGAYWFLDHCYAILSSRENRDLIMSISRDGEHHRWLIDDHHRNVRERLIRLLEIFMLYHTDRSQVQTINPRAVAEQLLILAEAMAYGPYCKGQAGANPPDKRARHFDVASRAIAAMYVDDCCLDPTVSQFPA